jgi:hypothetical protein
LTPEDWLWIFLKLIQKGFQKLKPRFFKIQTNLETFSKIKKLGF